MNLSNERRLYYKSETKNLFKDFMGKYFELDNYNRDKMESKFGKFYNESASIYYTKKGVTDINFQSEIISKDNYDEIVEKIVKYPKDIMLEFKYYEINSNDNIFENECNVYKLIFNLEYRYVAYHAHFFYERDLCYIEEFYEYSDYGYQYLTVFVSMIFVSFISMCFKFRIFYNNLKLNFEYLDYYRSDQDILSILLAVSDKWFVFSLLFDLMTVIFGISSVIAENYYSRFFKIYYCVLVVGNCLLVIRKLMYFKYCYYPATLLFECSKEILLYNLGIVPIFIGIVMFVSTAYWKHPFFYSFVDTLNSMFAIMYGDSILDSMRDDTYSGDIFFILYIFMYSLFTISIIHNIFLAILGYHYNNDANMKKFILRDEAHYLDVFKRFKKFHKYSKRIPKVSSLKKTSTIKKNDQLYEYYKVFPHRNNDSMTDSSHLKSANYESQYKNSYERLMNEHRGSQENKFNEQISSQNNLSRESRNNNHNNLSNESRKEN